MTRYWPVAVGIVVYAVAVSLANYRFIGAHSLLDLGFGFGPAVKTMVETGRYQLCYPPEYYERFGDYCMVAARVPLVPLFLWLMSEMTLWALPALVVKNNRHVVPFIVMVLFCAAWVPAWRSIIIEKASTA